MSVIKAVIESLKSNPSYKEKAPFSSSFPRVESPPTVSGPLPSRRVPHLLNLNAVKSSDIDDDEAVLREGLVSLVP